MTENLMREILVLLSRKGSRAFLLDKLNDLFGESTVHLKFHHPDAKAVSLKLVDYIKTLMRPANG